MNYDISHIKPSEAKMAGNRIIRLMKEELRKLDSSLYVHHGFEEQIRLEKLQDILFSSIDKIRREANV